MANDNIFVKINGVDGESTDAEYSKWVHCLSFNHGISQPKSATDASAGGGTTASCDHQDYSVTKYVDLASPKLYEICSSGKHIPDVTIVMLRASGDKRVKYMEIKMENVVISHVAPAGGHDFPTESVAFNYGKIKWTYTQQKRADGTPGGQCVGGWSLVEGKVHA